ncbi:hypothetical protein A1Q2_05083 [Trichosporon asahii var. asahii CBS 8904]|uniref:Uncharacterized protein n=1 Tax=Trichosporon asahii var. asahii (strain CBS 8904) TaxID=1220162 RepID=K1V9B7_TRIAC|nr:hypothetical protein A1Q2_05083 [Trichosporon asahii var. asahii CBS 8904]
MAPTSQGESTTMGAVMPSTVGSSGLNLAAINLDPSLLALASGTSSTPLDPALFTIEQVVNDVREGRIGPDDLRDEPKPPDHTEEGVSEPVIEEEPHPHTHAQPEPEPEPETELQLDDDGIDPALREIVNSLTNAQQSHPIAPGDERETLDRERLQHTLQSTLEDFAQGNFGSYGAIFNTNFPQSPNHLVLPLEEPVPEPTVPVKRGRGRPKGSKNKPKPGQPTEPPPPPPRKPKGRPPKVRTAEELEEFERRKEEKALGIKRKRGRPRKYPELGLVREMRLKKNREAVQEKIRMLEERARLEEAAAENGGSAPPVEQPEAEMRSEEMPPSMSASDVAQVAEAVARQEQGNYAWSYPDGQSLLDVVGASYSSMQRGDIDDVVGSMDGGGGNVFGLPDVGGVSSVDEQQ